MICGLILDCCVSRKGVTHSGTWLPATQSEGRPCADTMTGLAHLGPRDLLIVICLQMVSQEKLHKHVHGYAEVRHTFVEIG